MDFTKTDDKNSVLADYMKGYGKGQVKNATGTLDQPSQVNQGANVFTQDVNGGQTVPLGATGSLNEAGQLQEGPILTLGGFGGKGNQAADISGVLGANPVATGGATAAAAEGGGDGRGGGVPATEGYSPELEALKKKSLGQDWFGETDLTKKMGSLMDLLGQPVDAEVGQSEAERQNIFNLGRRQIQGATSAMMSEAAKRMGGQGLYGGESGLADTALGQIASQGAEKLGTLGSEIARDEAARRFQEQMAKAGLNTQRLQGALAGGGAIADVLGQRYGLGLKALETGGGLEQALKNLELQKQQMGAAAAAGASAADLRERQFAYDQQMDALKLLMGYYGQGQEQQQGAYQPYWSGASGTY